MYHYHILLIDQSCLTHNKKFQRHWERVDIFLRLRRFSSTLYLHAQVAFRGSHGFTFYHNGGLS